MIDVNPQQEITVPTVNNSNSNRNLILIIVLVGLALAIGIVMWIFRDILFTQGTKQNTATSKQITSSVQSTAKVTGTSGSTAELAFYTDTENGYSVQYPKTWFDIPKDSYSNGAKFFSTDDVKKSDEISSKGIFLVMSLIKENSDYFKTLLNGEIGFVIDGADGTSTKLTNTTIDSQKAATFSYETKTDVSSNHYYVTDYIVSKGDSMYSFAFITHDKTIADKNADIYKAIMASIKFL